MAYGQRGLLTVGGTCAFGVVLGVFSVRMFTGDTNMNLLGLQLYFFLAGFLVGPTTKSFVAGALIGLTSAILGVFSGFLMSSEVAWVNPLVYLFIGGVGTACGGLGALARADLHRVRDPKKV